MLSREQLVVGLEIGTSKICAAIGAVGPGGGLQVLGVGSHPSTGVRKGEIIDLHRATKEIREAIGRAEDQTNAEVSSVYLGISGAHITGSTNRGIHPIPSSDRTISPDDVTAALSHAKLQNLPNERWILHHVRQDFIVDDQAEVKDPVGMLGNRLEARVHVVTGNGLRVGNSIRALTDTQIGIDEVVFCGLASAMTTLSRAQKDAGALVIDLGGGTTEFALYYRDILRHSGVIALGGDHVTNDLAIGFRIGTTLAETLKLAHGGAFVDDRCRGGRIEVPSETGTPAVYSLEHLRRIQEARLEETFELVAQELGPLLHWARSGVYLVGGGARTPGLTALAKRVFQLDVQLGRTQDISGSSDDLDHPEHACAIGLLRYGALRLRQKPRGLARVKQVFQETFSR